MSYPVESQQITAPSLEDVASAIRSGLAANFETVEVSVENCPNLKEAPFNLPASGLCGSPRIADVGGVPYLVPTVVKSKIYDISELAALTGLPDAFVLGAAAGPFNVVGFNSEMMPNLITGKKAAASNNNTCISYMEGDNFKFCKLPQEKGSCSLMFNMFACEGQPGKVIKVKAKKRTGPENFTKSILKALDSKYQPETVGLGGVFRLVSGGVNCHIMPENFSSTPLTMTSVNDWLKYAKFPGPMTFFTVIVSRDPGLDLRLEHSHGYGENYGGHYEYDTTPETVEYEGYFQVAESIYRIDRPQK